jgi:hypothetical protein
VPATPKPTFNFFWQASFAARACLASTHALCTFWLAADAAASHHRFVAAGMLLAACPYTPLE